jgi:hypothetical protein
MAETNPDAVTLGTLHDDLGQGFAEMRAGFADLRTEMRSGFADLKTEMRAGFGDLKTTLVAGFRGLPTRESSEEMVRLLRESNRLQEERFAQLDVRIREQHLETQQVLHAVVDSQRVLLEGQRALLEGQRALLEGQRALLEIRALVARLDALIDRRGDGGRTA